CAKLEEAEIRNHLRRYTLAILALFTFRSFTFAQTGAQSRAAEAQATPPTPDLSGVWYRVPVKDYYVITTLPIMRPWAEEKFKAAKHGSADSDPSIQCFPPGVPRVMMEGEAKEIIQIPGRVIMLFERDHIVRQIYTDGRGHPKDL